MTPPRIADLDPHAARRACIVVLHAPRETGPGRTAWTVSLVDIRGVVLASDDLTARDHPHPLDELVRPHLDPIGRVVDGDWVTDQDARGEARHRARLRG